MKSRVVQKNMSVEDVQVLLYLARRNGNYEKLIEHLLASLEQWQNAENQTALEVVMFGLQADAHTSKTLFDHIYAQLKESEHVSENVQILERCAKPATVHPDLINYLWYLLGSSEDAEISESVSKILVLQLSSRIECANFSVWWRAIVSCLNKTYDKRFIAAGLKTWLTCLGALSADDIRPIISKDAETYFSLLERHVSQASKFALQILGESLEIITGLIDNQYMKYNPATPGIKAAWSRYISVVEIIGIDTSVHQTLDSLPDFAALLAPSSPIPANWLISLINVGAVSSNTEGIRTLVMQLLLEAHTDQLWALAAYPQYVATVLYPKFLQTANFVFISGRCLHAERLEKFTEHYMNALLASGGVREFFGVLAQYLLEHCHGFEAPRVLVFDAMSRTLPRGSLTSHETRPLLAAAKATVQTYTSRSMAELYLAMVKKLIESSGTPEIEKSEDVNAAVTATARDELAHQSFLERETLKRLSELKLVTWEPPVSSTKYDSLLDAVWPLQYSRLSGKEVIPQPEVRSLLTKSLQEPEALNATQRQTMSQAVENAFECVGSTSYELCELAFAAFNDTPTRLSALKAFKRSKPHGIPAAYLEILWSHLQEATLRIIDRELHHEFIDLLTTPGVVDPQDWLEQQSICIEIVQLSVLRRNLLVPLAVGLQRVHEKWVLTVMAHIFAFIGSREYTVLLEELVAKRYGVYEKNWGPPESRARGIAAVYLKQFDDDVLAATDDTLEQAKLDVKITGSFDNVEAHLRVLHYQILILLQDRWPQEKALEIMRIARASLEHEPNPPVRVHIEWLIGLIGATHLATSFTPFVLTRIDELDINRGIPPRILGSLIRIAMLLYFTSKVYAIAQADNDKIGSALIDQIIPLATSNKAVVRHRAISALFILNKKDMAPPSYKDLVARIANTNEAGVRGSGYQNEAFLWDVKDTSLGSVCGGVCSTVFDREMPNTLHEADLDLAPPADYGYFWKSEGAPAESVFPELVIQRESTVRDAVNQPYSTDFSSQIQTKSGTFDVEYKERRTSLVLVATLCDKPVNLGAICRLSDALGVSKLVMRNTEVTGDQQFKTTALTSEKWIPLEQVGEPDLPAYLRTMKSQGYTLVGIEQTDSSKILRSTLQFPEKTLLMMGHEKQGIPAEILALLDACVEIEQLGYVRSMNIQTATAVVVHAYNQNHGPDISRVDYKK